MCMCMYKSPLDEGLEGVGAFPHIDVCAPDHPAFPARAPAPRLVVVLMGHGSWVMVMGQWAMGKGRSW